VKITVKAEPRSVQGTGASRRLRRESKVPGVLYGAGKDAQPIQLDHKDLWFKLKMEAFHASILDMEVGSREVAGAAARLPDAPVQDADPACGLPARRREQEDPHEGAAALRECRDLARREGRGRHRAARDERARDLVPAEGPARVHRGGPEDLQAGHSLHLSALTLPPGVEAVVTKGEDPTVATIVIPKVKTEEEELAEAAAAAAVSAADVPTTAQKTAEELARRSLREGLQGGGAKDKEKK
jgi:large subunit ribosomal protein L25